MLIHTSDFRVTVPALLFEPGFLAADFSPDRKLTKFLVVEESMLDESPFIDIRFEPLAQAQFWVETRQLFELEGLHDIERPRPAFIFHHAFVCSTLLARCLAQSEAFFSLKEPWILRRLADVKRAGVPGPEWDEAFDKYLRLLCRNFRSGRIPVIKATNVANNLLPDVLRHMPEQPVLFLYSDLESFLVSNLKKAADTQGKMAGLAQTFLSDGDFARQYPRMADPSNMSLLQACALVWLVSLHNFRQAIGERRSPRVATLDAQDFLDDPVGTLGRLSRHFGHRADAAGLQRMADTRTIGTHAKEPSRVYGPEQRRSEMEEIRSRHGREIAQALAWAEPVATASGMMEYMQSRRLAA
ncbi:MAG TPA: hypothetical protein VD701_09205 [Steroidobacteraceae bacterium]|nr:hypothetical protein [Steroidobacteraceae bacterium]